ncbi:MAG TPA: hypothetical protein VJP79_05780 [Nitrososphaera sp.]|nr:hypothetical protein [Nitrososphaera sp.]
MSILMPGALIIHELDNFELAYADGGDRKEIPASLEGRDATLLVKISPPVLTSDNIQDASIMFRLFDSNTNETIKFVSLFLFISKDGKLLIPPDLFHSAEGILRLKIQPSQGKTVIYANKEPHLDAWEADPAGVINLKGPLLLEGGLYRIHIEVFGIDSPFNIFEEDKIPKFDAYLSVGDIYNTQVQNENKSYNMTIVSYYDYVKDFSFDPEKNEFTWTMPFNYDLTRIENEGDIFIHEEIRIPRALSGIEDAKSFSGSVDGMQLLPSSVVMDPYASESELIIHFLIDKEHISQITRASPQLDSLGIMKFTLIPSSSITHREKETSTVIYSDMGKLMVTLSWNPGQLAANTPADLHLKFYDAYSGGPITGNVTYDLFVYPTAELPEQMPVITMLDNLALNGTGTVSNIIFPQNDVYDIEIRVKDATLASSTSQDSTPADRALGVVVVPEFETIAGLVMATSILASLFASRYVKFEK